MKIGDVKVGVEYAAQPSPTARNAGPKEARRVKVLEIASSEETRRSGWNTSKKVKVRKVRVQFLDAPLVGYSYNRFHQEQNAIAIIEARMLVSEWREVAADHKKAWAHETARTETRTLIEAELNALGLSNASVRAQGPGVFRISLNQDDWAKIQKLV